MGMFDSLFSNQDSVNAATAANKGIKKGLNAATDQINSGVNAYSKYAGEAGDKFNPFYRTGVAGNRMYGNALGLYGEAGNAKAVDAFQAGPGYEFQMDQGLQAIDRGAASRGMLSSGNLLQAEQKYGSDLANQEYQNWLKNVYAASTSGQQAAQSQANILTGVGDKEYDAGKTKGQLEYTAATGMGNNLAGAELANQQASQNIFGAITGGLNLAGKVMGMGF